jgi:hypothetical protein
VWTFTRRVLWRVHPPEADSSVSKLKLPRTLYSLLSILNYKTQELLSEKNIEFRDSTKYPRQLKGFIKKNVGFYPPLPCLPRQVVGRGAVVEGISV